METKEIQVRAYRDKLVFHSGAGALYGTNRDREAGNGVNVFSFLGNIRIRSSGSYKEEASHSKVVERFRGAKTGAKQQHHDSAASHGDTSHMGHGQRMRLRSQSGMDKVCFDVIIY